MRLLRFSDLPYHKTPPSVITIGNFDGVHLGHQFVLKQVNNLAKSQSLVSTVVCFEPQPKDFFSVTHDSLRLTPFRDKIKAFDQAKINQILCLAFTQKIAALTPLDFVEIILKKGLNAHHVIVGNDFKFGHQREGDFTQLKKLGQQFGFGVTSLPDYLQNETRISSSQIRTLLQENHFTQAKDLLGRAYTLSGRIHYGNQNGRKIGFPTINIPMQQTALAGVYVVKVILKDSIHFGVANIGTRPTICGKKRLLETHIFNFKHDLYGQYVTIEFLRFIRGEQKFSSFDALKLQISQDKISALDWLESETTYLNT